MIKHLRLVRKSTIIEQAKENLEEIKMKIKKVLSLVLAVGMIASVALTGCGNQINENDVAATLDGEDIPLELVNFMAQYTAVSYDSLYLPMMGEEMWTQDLYGTGTTMADNVKDGIMSQIQTGYLLAAHMEEYGVTISDEEISAMEQAADNFLADNTEEAIKTMGAKKEHIVKMLWLNLVQRKMQQAIYDTADTNVSDEEAAQRTFSYIKIATNGYMDADNNQVAYTEEELAGLAEDAEKAAVEAKEDFDKAAADNNYTISTYSYGSDEIDEEGAATRSMNIAVIQAANELSEGDVSSLIEVEGDGYYILRLDSELDREATDNKKEQIVTQRKSDKYNEVLKSYQDACEWEINEKELKKVKFDGFYTIKQEVDTEAEQVSGTE